MLCKISRPKYRAFLKQLKINTNIALAFISSDTRNATNNPSQDDFPSHYNPEISEKQWYNFWENQGYFTPRNDPSRETFSMVIPPPNVTGNLHLGHALTVTLQDIVARWQRMKGKDVLWIPGFDHAGIATQVIVERKLMAEKGLKRDEIGREAFLQEVTTWKNERINDITQQFRLLGASLDFSRTCFTMDDKFSAAVKAAFIQLFEDGYIYRKEKLINWCCHLQSVVSDIEVSHVELNGRTMIQIPGVSEPIEYGILDYFAYPIENSNEEIVVATTRIETMLGDVAIAVNPNDNRYANLIGQNVTHPFTHKSIPIIGDNEVSTLFGTGALKITPAHDPIDFTIGLKHGLKPINVLDDRGCVESNFDKFNGMHRSKARKEIRASLAAMGLHRETKSHKTTIPICSRSGDIIERRLKHQWFLKLSEFSHKAMKDVKNGSLRFYPDSTADWNNWLSHDEDWCISRQLWWGHKIPIFKVSLPSDKKDLFVAANNLDEALNKAKQLHGEECEVKQVEDVLDTWFSSALFPLAALGWPEESEDINKYYPLSLMETGNDILFFWVAKMVMLCSYLIGQNPFDKVLLHGLLCDSTGKKMSKSSGNVMDPMDIINGTTQKELCDRLVKSHQEGAMSKFQFNLLMENIKNALPEGIPLCSADSLRLALSRTTIKEQAVAFDVQKVLKCRHFCNKIWQAVRFYLRSIEMVESRPNIIDKNYDTKDFKDIDLWILSQLAKGITTCNNALENFDFPEAAEALMNFWIYNYCDVYLELVKSRPNELNVTSEVMATCIYTFLKAISPFMPFLSEDLYQKVFKDENLADASITVTSYPEKNEWSNWINKDLDKNIEFMLSVTKVIRSLKTINRLGKDAKVIIVCTNNDYEELINGLESHVRFLGRVESLTVQNEPPEEKFKYDYEKVNDDVIVYLDVQVNASFVLQRKFERFNNELDKLRRIIGKASYQRKASRNLKASNLERIAYLEKEIENIKKHSKKSVANE